MSLDKIVQRPCSLQFTDHRLNVENNNEIESTDSKTQGRNIGKHAPSLVC